MKNNTSLALAASLIALIGFPALFLVLSLITGQWMFLAWSIGPSLVAGLTGLMLTRNQIKKEQGTV